MCSAHNILPASAPSIYRLPIPRQPFLRCWRQSFTAEEPRPRRNVAQLFLIYRPISCTAFNVFLTPCITFGLFLLYIFSIKNIFTRAPYATFTKCLPCCSLGDVCDSCRVEENPSHACDVSCCFSSTEGILCQKARLTITQHKRYFAVTTNNV